MFKFLKVNLKNGIKHNKYFIFFQKRAYIFRLIIKIYIYNEQRHRIQEKKNIYISNINSQIKLKKT